GGFGGGGGSDSAGSGTSGGTGSDSSTANSGDYSGPLGNEAADGTSEDVVNAAESQLGVPYVADAESPGKAFDCSGLAKYAWAKAGVDLPHNAAMMYNDTAQVDHVPLSQLKPGDLLFYNDGGRIHHVAIYAGDGKMIEAPAPGLTVREVPVRTHGLMPMAGRPHK
ncbi:MAG TPA: C40 family peptidase, partial [Chroococcales cyanobacterium]